MFFVGASIFIAAHCFEKKYIIERGGHYSPHYTIANAGCILYVVNLGVSIASALNCIVLLSPNTINVINKHFTAKNGIATLLLLRTYKSVWNKISHGLYEN